MKRMKWGAARALAMLAVCACTALAVVALAALAAPASAPAWALVSPAAPVPAAEPAFPAYKQDALQATLEAQRATFDAPGAVAGLWMTDAGAWVSTAGTGDLATGAAAQPTDRFRIGSITKTFTATVVLQLVDEKKLALGDRLSEYVPWVPGAHQITVRELLNMTSGLYNFTASDAFWTRVMEHPEATWTPRQVVKLAVSHKPLFSPGAQYMYCNTNYILLGMIIEKVTGRSAAHEITTRIIEKLGLENTSFPTSPAMPEPDMHGYVPADGEPSDSAKLRDWTVASPTPYWTAGAMVSSMHDLRTWMTALAGGELLSRKMHAAQLRFKAPNTASYGLGVTNAGKGFGHSGGIPGYNTSMYFFPSMKATIVAVINRYPSAIEGASDEVAGALVRTLVDDPRDTFTYPDPADFSSLAWTEAFGALHEKFSHEYAFGAWKGVDWAGLYEEFAPRIAQAQAARDEKAYYLALHEYACSIPDGHISLAAEDTSTPTAIAEELVGGGFGMAVAELDDWSVVAAAVVPDGPAAAAGIEAGAEIVSWGGVPTRTAIGQIDVGAVPYKLLTGAFGGEDPQATREHERLEQARLLTRAPVGASVRVAFRNPGSTAVQTAALKAIDDDGQSFRLMDFAARPEFSSQVDSRILQDGYGYVLVRMEYDPSGDGGYPIRVYEQFRAAIASFVAADVPGVILDLRGNYGGSDQLAADMCGFFYSHPAFYEEQELFDKRTGDFLRITVAENGPVPIVTQLTIEPQAPHFGGPVVVLVNPGTKSSGEGPAARISALPNGTVIGFHGTNGSFGMVGGGATLPGGYSLEYPYGRSVDQHGIIQLDSRNGIGGVAPDLRVPMTLDNVLAFAQGKDVELEYAVKYLDQAVR